MKSLKLIVMTGIILATSVSASMGECTSVKYTLLNEYGKDVRDAQPQKKENRYPERFPALVREYDFLKLNLKRISKF